MYDRLPYYYILIVAVLLGFLCNRATGALASTEHILSNRSTRLRRSICSDVLFTASCVSVIKSSY